MNGDFSNWSNEVRWLQWKHLPHKKLPSSLELPNLAILDLANNNCLTCVSSKLGIESKTTIEFHTEGLKWLPHQMVDIMCSEMMESIKFA
jgi:hypothetical protein